MLIPDLYKIVFTTFENPSYVINECLNYMFDPPGFKRMRIQLVASPTNFRGEILVGKKCGKLHAVKVFWPNPNNVLATDFQPEIPGRIWVGPHLCSS